MSQKRKRGASLQDITKQLCDILDQSQTVTQLALVCGKSYSGLAHKSVCTAVSESHAVIFFFLQMCPFCHKNLPKLVSTHSMQPPLVSHSSSAVGQVPAPIPATHPDELSTLKGHLARS